MMRPLDPTEWLHAKRLEALATGDHAGFDHATALLDTLDQCDAFLRGEDAGIDALETLKELDKDMSDYPGKNRAARLDWLYRLVDKLQDNWPVDTLAQLPDRIEAEVDQMTEQYETIRSVLVGADVIGPNEYPDNETIGTLLRMFLPAVTE